MTEASFFKGVTLLFEILFLVRIRDFLLGTLNGMSQVLFLALFPKLRKQIKIQRANSI